MTTLTATPTRSADVFVGALTFGFLAPAVAGPVAAVCFFASRIDGAESLFALVLMSVIAAYPIGVVPAMLVGLLAGRWRRRLHLPHLRIGLILLSALVAALWVTALGQWLPPLPSPGPGFAALSAALGAAVACTLLIGLACGDGPTPHRNVLD